MPQSHKRILETLTYTLLTELGECEDGSRWIDRAQDLLVVLGDDASAQLAIEMEDHYRDNADTSRVLAELIQQTLGLINWRTAAEEILEIAS